MANQIHELVQEWRERGPVAWAEGRYGWVGVDGQPVKLADWQRAVLDAWWERRDQVTTFAISNIKKTGKTFVNSLLLAWRWLALPGLHFCVGNDLDQGLARQFSEIADMARRNPFLAANVKFSAKTLEFIPTGSVLQALAGDATGNAGANHLTVSHTETWGIIHENDTRNFEELTPPPGRVWGLPALRICDSYAGFLDESNVWHGLVDRGLAGDLQAGAWPLYLDGGLLLFHMTGEEAQKRCYRGTAGEAKIYYRDQRASLRDNTYKRLHENQRMVNIGTFIDQDAWEALIDPDLKPLAGGSTVPVYIGLDLALAAGGDNCALIGTYFDGGKVKTAFHKVWRGGVFRRKKLVLSETVEPYILDLARRYKVDGVFMDPWQGIHLAEGLRRAGLRVVEVNQTHTTRGAKDTMLYELAANGQLALYDDPELRNAAAGANAKELGNGQIFLQKSGGRSKIDLLVALSNCADECNAQGQGFGGVTSIPNIFYAWSREDGSTGDLNDFLFTPSGWEFVPDRNVKPHPPGVTWQNCTRRNRGCEACVQELTEAGYYNQLETNKGQTIPMTEADYYASMAGLLNHKSEPQEASHEYKQFRAAFWANVHNRKLAGGGPTPEGHPGGEGKGQPIP